MNAARATFITFSEIEHNMGLAYDWNEWKRTAEASEDIDK